MSLKNSDHGSWSHGSHSYKSWTLRKFMMENGFSCKRLLGDMLSFMLDLEIAEIVLSKREEKPVFLWQKPSPLLLLYSRLSHVGYNIASIFYSLRRIARCQGFAVKVFYWVRHWFLKFAVCLAVYVNRFNTVYIMWYRA